MIVWQCFHFWGISHILLESSDLELKKALSTRGKFVKTWKLQTTHIYFNLRLLRWICFYLQRVLIWNERFSPFINYPLLFQTMMQIFSVFERLVLLETVNVIDEIVMDLTLKMLVLLMLSTIHCRWKKKKE